MAIKTRLAFARSNDVEQASCLFFRKDNLSRFQAIAPPQKPIRYIRYNIRC
jgi:hypothetical protein